MALGLAGARILGRAAFGAAAALLWSASTASAQDGFEPAPERMFEYEEQDLSALRRPIVGLALEFVDGDDARSAGQIVAIEAGYPADLAGLQVGDLIVAVDGAPATSTQDLIDGIRAAAGGLDSDSVEIGVVRAGEALSFDVAPWITPDPERDAALFPYPESQGPSTALLARIGLHDYELIAPPRVFSTLRAIGLDSSLNDRRIAFRVRLASCGELASLRRGALAPTADLSPELALTPSLLFDRARADAERAACDAYFEAHDLRFSTPVAVLAGRFVADVEGHFGDAGATLFLTDAALFDQRHVTLGAEIVSLVELMARLGLFAPE